MFKKSKKIINMVIEDYAIRIVETGKNQISPVTILEERPLPLGFITNGKIVDEIGFFDYMKELVKELAIKNRKVRFYVPNSLIIMREVEFPSDLKEKEIREHFEYEIGNSIHLPFKDPIFDIHYQAGEHEQRQNNMRNGMLFAAPREELMKYSEILDDVSLKPIAADVEALGIYRYYHYIYGANPDTIYMFLNLSVTSMNIGIFQQHELEFLRYQSLDLQLSGSKLDEELDEIIWEYEEDEAQQYGILDDQILEMERIMNFYRFSLKKGEAKVDEIILVGDNPHLNHFYQLLHNRLEVPTRLLQGYLNTSMDREIGGQYIPALGLALKGGIQDAT